MIVCAVLILVSIATPFLNIFFRKLQLSDEQLPSEHDTESHSTDEDSEESATTSATDEKRFHYPSVSIVLFAHDNARDLEQHLPAILEQDYPAGFEVIVVQGKSEDDTEDVLKKLKNEHKNLYTTFVPDSARYMSRPKLAITLGVKAAHNEWMLLTEPNYHPASDQWLLTMARNCHDDKDIVIGYSNFNDEATHYQRFERLLCQRYILREAQRRTAYRSEPGNLMFRKSTFINGRSFDGNLKYIRGEYDFIVNKFATRSNTTTETHPLSWMIEDAPTKKQWNNHHLFYMETRQHLKRSFAHALPFKVDQIALHLNMLLIISALIFSITSLVLDADPSSFFVHPSFIITASAILALVISTILRTVIARKAMKAFGEDIPASKVVPFEWSIVWRLIYYKLKHHMADKYDFICHKV